MTNELASELTGACVTSSMSRIISDEYVPLPADVSLEDLLAANRIVGEGRSKAISGGGFTMQMHCDPRIVALLYAFEHYGSNPEDLLEALGYELSHS